MPRHIRKRLTPAVGACLLFLALIGRPTLADTTPAATTGADLTDMSLEELSQVKIRVVYGASRYEQKVESVPASVSILTAADIRDYGYRTLAEALNGVRGMYINYDRNYTLLGLRGFQLPGDSNSRILLLVDGQRMNENIYEGAMVGTDFILDIDLIDRIEVVRGPGSSIYGSNALFGVINIVTRDAAGLRGVESSLKTGSFGSHTARFSFGRQTRGGTDFLVSGSLMRSEGPRRLYFPEFADPATHGGFAVGLDDDRSINFLATLSRGGATLQGALSSREKGVPTASYGTTFNDPHLRTTDTQAFVNLKFRRSFAGTTDIMTRASYSYYGYRGTYPYAGEDSTAPVLNKDDVLGDWLELEGQLTHRLPGRHTLVAGLEHRRNLRQEVMNFDENPRNVLTDLHHSSLNSGAYGQGEFALGRALGLTTGLRYDHYEGFGGTLNPRLGFVYEPDASTDLKLLYGRAFRAPNVFETAVFDQASKANPALKPETVRSYELILERRLDANFKLTALGFLNRVDGLITQVVDPADSLIVNRNTDRVEARGLELEVAGRLAGGLRGRASYTMQSSENRDRGQVLAISPRHVARLNFRLPLAGDRLGAGLELQYSSSVRTLAGHPAGAIWLTNLTIASRDLPGGLDLSGSLYNLFDWNYAHPGAGQHLQEKIRQDGRTFLIRATGRF